MVGGTESLPSPFELLVKNGPEQAFWISTASQPAQNAQPETEPMPLQPAVAENSAEPAATETETPEPTETDSSVEAQQAAVQTMVEWGAVRAGDDAEKASAAIPLLLIFALFGGIILNLMPCVFPVLGIKVLGFVQHASEGEATTRKHGLAFGAGVLASMWVLALVVFILKSVGNDQLLWGAQFQNPVFVVLIAVVLFVFGLNLAGVFEIGTGLTGVGQELQTKEGLSGSFFSGILVVVVSTPCSGPFMAAALGPALTGPRLTEFAIFTALGIGLAFPYVLLSYIPALVEKLPRPGRNGWRLSNSSCRFPCLPPPCG